MSIDDDDEESISSVIRKGLYRIKIHRTAPLLVSRWRWEKKVIARRRKG